jgi:hypothetical protein
MKATLRKKSGKKLRKSVRNGGSKSKASKTMTPAEAEAKGQILFPHGPLSEHGKLRYAVNNSGAGGHLTSVSIKPVALVKNGSVSVYAQSHANAGEPKTELRPVLEHEPIENFDDVKAGQKLLVESFDLSNPVLSKKGRPNASYSKVLTVKNIEQPAYLEGRKAIVTFEEIDPATSTNVQLFINLWTRSLTHYSQYYAFKPEKSDLDQMKYWADK